MIRHTHQDGTVLEVENEIAAKDLPKAVLKALEAARIPSEDASIAFVPKNLIKLEGKNASGMLRCGADGPPSGIVVSAPLALLRTTA